MRHAILITAILIISSPALAAKPPSVAQCMPTLVANEEYNDVFKAASDRFNRGEIEHPQELAIRKAAKEKRWVAILQSLPRIPEGATRRIAIDLAERASEICERLYGNKMHHLWLMPE